MAVEVKEFWAQFSAAWTVESLTEAGFARWVEEYVPNSESITRERQNMSAWRAIACVILEGGMHDSQAWRCMRKVLNGE